jgi:hypothetical protein
VSLYSGPRTLGAYRHQIQCRSTCATNCQSRCPRSILDRHLQTIHQLFNSREEETRCTLLGHTPLAQTVQHRTVLSFQRALHNAELQRGVLRRVVDAVDREVISAESTGVVPGVVAGRRRGVGAAAVHFPDAVEVRVAVASEAVVDPDLGREAVVVLQEIVSLVLDFVSMSKSFSGDK